MPRPARSGAADGPPVDLLDTATAVVDGEGVVVAWSEAAERLLGHRAAEVLGRPAAALLARDEDGGPDLPDSSDTTGTVRVRHRDGRTLTLGLQVDALTDLSGERRWQLAAVDLARAPWWEVSRSVLERFLTRSPYGIAVLDTDLRYVWLNRALEEMAGVGMEQRLGRTMGEVLPKLSPNRLESVMRQVLETGVPVLDFEYRGHVPADPDREHTFSTSFLRLDDADGRVMGLCYMGVDITERRRTRERLTLLTDSGARIGTTLDFTVTADELVEVAVPRLADVAVLDLFDAVLRGEEPGYLTDPVASLVRMAHRSTRTGNPDLVGVVGRAPGYSISSPMARCLTEGVPLLETDLAGEEPAWLLEDPARRETVERWGVRSLIVLPVRARGVVLGLAVLLRLSTSEPFEPEDVSLAEELVSRAAVCLDNARRYTRERHAVLALQRSLLPQAVPAPSGLEVAHRYRPAHAAGVGGDWYDVIPLSGARVALVVGDVTGHGIESVAAMGRLRTAVHTLADLDLPPDELLAHLDDLVLRLVDEQPAGRTGGAGAAALGTTCLYVVYDPVARRCSVARAGALPPAVVAPDGAVTFPELPAGPPLGIGALPFEAGEFDLPDGALLALFTDGLLLGYSSDADRAMERLRHVLADAGPGPEGACDALFAALRPSSHSDDVALLVARAQGLAQGQVAEWNLPAAPSVVAESRSLTVGALAAWGLEHLAFTTELVVSELVTNAIRYGAEPITLRLVRHSVLICEVSDGSSTSPRLRHARTTDEGGRGLFLIAQLTHRWGTRYTGNGKTIWTEQLLTGENDESWPP
ncbi:SpoIIE family protein phosphatase [Kitasatospora paracochleata]|uniref:PAS domain S-box-containing protein n=1 Tax=Kitasatospora paracochleata TaxID=58354 RepID=A0ABT1IWV3_9ACTN|nr:SpoIIE family protein phosphatase [Kitasatospora paracochleata]MCP2309388.1 PAS domain S-box-containing protein [Kitasatospora paracochleata]